MLADPDTPYLHVGLNSPKSTMWDTLGLTNRSFGVGIQNATRHILPLTEGERAGDGVLRLQARGGFGKGRGGAVHVEFNFPLSFCNFLAM